MNWYVWTRALFISLSGFMFGYEMGSLNGVKDMEGYRLALNLSYLPQTSEGINASDLESCDSQDDVETSAVLGLIVSVFFVGALIGALVAGFISDLAGRKPAVILGASLVAIGSLLHTAAVHLGMVLVGRTIAGIGLGVLYQVTPLYMAEIAPEDLRGRLLSLITVYNTFAYFTGTLLNIIVKKIFFGWRISLSVQLVVGLSLALGMFLLPRSPRWLVKKHRNEEALVVLVKICCKDEDKAWNQLEEIKLSCEKTKEPLSQTLKYMLKCKTLQRILLGFSIHILARLSGANFVLYYSVSIFCSIGLPGFVASILIGVLNIALILCSLLIIDKIGRKPILLIGAFLDFACLIIAASLIIGYDLEDGLFEEFTVSQRVAGYFMMTFMCIFVGVFSMSFGCVPWIIMGEFFPLRGRSLMISISSTGFWIGVVVVNEISPILVSSSLRLSGTVLLFAGINLLVFMFILLVVPETKGRTLEKMEELFSKPWLERVNVLYYLRCGCFWDPLSSSKGNKYTIQEEEEDTQEMISTSSSSSLDRVLSSDSHE